MSRLNSIEDLNLIKKNVLNNLNDKTQIKVSMSTCGIATGAREIKEIFERECKVKNMKNVIISQSGCMGLCHSEPTIEVVIPGRTSLIFGHVNEKKVKDIIEKYIIGKKEVSGVIESDNKQVKIALNNCGFIDPEVIEDAIGVDGYQALGKALTTMTPQEVIDEIKLSGLRGRGGGGFPTGLKWEFAAKNSADQKYVVCNADEGDPGAFMDRSVLEGNPHSVLEAMAICGYSIGATKGLIYTRAEYPLAVKRLNIAIKQARESGLLGKGILGSDFNFDIELKIGAGAFVCGEETSLIKSMEGERGEPVSKPPFPAESGYWSKPTNVNNVETFANISPILLKGGKWFKEIGTEKSSGTKVFALAGKIKNVGLVEVPMGTTLREVIFDIGGGILDGKKFKSVQTGGPSGGCLTEKDLDTPIDFDNLIAKGSMMGSGGMIVMDEDNCMVSVAKFYLEFTVEESCGKCTPCRIGNTRLHEILEKITEGKGTMEDLDHLRELSETIKDTSLCGLGQTSPNPVLSTLNNFYDEYLAHVRDKKCPAGECTKLLTYTINEKCIGCTACSRACPVACIKGKVKEMHEIDQTKCIKCGVCHEKCKFGAIDKL